jgi:hypothetical protein
MIFGCVIFILLYLCSMKNDSENLLNICLITLKVSGMEEEPEWCSQCSNMLEAGWSRV